MRCYTPMNSAIAEASRSTFLIALCFVLVLTTFILQNIPALSDNGWTLTTIDSTGDVGSWTSNALGSDGFARISYYDTTNADLKFVQCTNADCSSKNISTVDSSGTVGIYTSLALGSDGFGRISYNDVSNTALKFVQCTNADCSSSNITTVDSTGDVG